MWALYIFEDEKTERRKYKNFASIVAAFRTGNELMKAKACRHYRVEMEGETNEA